MQVVRKAATLVVMKAGRKDIERIISLKLIGNEAVQNRKYRLAIRDYTKAILLGIKCKYNELHVLYSNRSATDYCLVNHTRHVQTHLIV